MPAAPVAPVAAAAAPQATSTTGDPAAGAVASFLSQPQAALASPASQPNADTLQGPDEDDGKSTDVDDAMPEMLAALGFVPVPAMLPALTTTVTGEAATEQAAAPAALTATLAPPPPPS